MKKAWIVAVAVAVLGGVAFVPDYSHVGAGATRINPDMTQKKEMGFYCDRAAVQPELRKHKEELGKTMRSRNQETRELPDGFEFRFPSDPGTIQAVAEWATLERLCCPFFDIDLRMEHDSGAFWMRLTGREGVKQFIRGEFSSMVNSPAGEKQ